MFVRRLRAARIPRRVLAITASTALCVTGAVVIAPAAQAATPTMAVSAQTTSTPGSQVLIKATVTCPASFTSAVSFGGTARVAGFTTVVGSSTDGTNPASMTFTGAAGSNTLTGTAVVVLPSADTFAASTTSGVTAQANLPTTGPCTGTIVGTGGVTLVSSPILSGFDTSRFDATAVSPDGLSFNSATGTCDDCSEQVTLPFAVSIAGTSYAKVWVNNNGLLSFKRAVSDYVGVTFPAPAANAYGPLIAPYWADVDTTPSTTSPLPTYTNCLAHGIAKWGTSTFDGSPAFGVTWQNVGSYPAACAHVDSFQVLLVSTPDIAAGAFKIVLNYGALSWTVGTASAGKSPQPGYDTGDGVHFTNLATGIAGGVQGLSFASNNGNVTGRFTLSSKIPSQLTWATPSAIDYGTPLTATQLHATATSPGTFTYDPPLGTVLTAGTHTLTAHFTSSDNTIADGTATVDLVVRKLTPSLTWSDPAGITYGALLGAAQLNATASVPGTFTYTVDATGAPAAGALLSAGQNQLLDVTFTPDDSTNYDTVTRSVAIDVAQASQAITFAPIGDHQFGDAAFAVNATGGGSGLPVTFTVASGSSCSLSNPQAGTDGNGNGTGSVSVTLTGAGTCAVTAAQAGNGNWVAPTSVTRSATVAQATPSLTWPVPAQIGYGATLGSTQLDASASVAGTYTYTIDGGTSDATGVVPDAGSHTLTVLFTPIDATDYTTATKSVTLNVAKAPQSITFAPLPGRTFGDAPFLLGATGGASGADVTYTVDEGPCTLSAVTGGTQVTILGAGACTISAAQDGTQNYLAAEPVSRSFDIAKAAPVLSWTAPAPIVYGTALSATQLDAQSSVVGTFAYALDSDPGDAAGVIPHAGHHTLHAAFTPSDTTDYDNADTQTALSVTRATPNLTWAPAVADLVYGDALGSDQLNAIADVDGTFTYTPAAGTVLPAGAQPLQVKFDPTDTLDYTSASTTAAINISRAPQTITFDTIADHTYGDAPFPVTASGGKSGNGVTFATADACSISDATTGTDSNGNGTGQATLTITGAGGCTVTASQLGTANYLPATDAVHSFTIAKKTPALTWPIPAAITYGTGLSADQLDASAPIGGTYAYTVDGGTADATGQKLHAGQHTLSVTFTPTDSSNYTPAATSVTITVNQAPQVINFAAIPAHRVGDAPFALTASGGASGQPVVFTVQDGSSCTVDPTTSKVMLTGAGTCTITASQAGNGDYATATPVIQSFAVNKAPSSLTLAPIPNHLYGDAPFAVSVSGTGSTSPISLSASPSTVCVITASNLVTLTGPGTCTVTASRAGDANYLAPAPATVTFAVSYRVAVLTDLSKSVHQNATLPVKIQITNAAGANLSSTTLTVHAVGVDATTFAPSPGSSQPGQDFTFTSPPAGYQYNVKTTTLAPGQHTLVFTVGSDPTQHSIVFTVTS
jgi:hypothetical protein